MDFVKDRNPFPIYQADRMVGLPDYVKQAAQISPGELDDMDSIAFADGAAREFPIHTKAATWLSAAYAAGTGLFDNPVVPGHIGERIKSAAAFHEITSDVDTLLAAFASHVKEAAAPEISYALSVDFGDHGGALGVQNFYPLQDVYDIVKSARDMLNDLEGGRLPVNYFRDASQELVKAARAESVNFDDIHPRVLAAGDERLPDYEHALLCADLRKNAGVDDEGLELYKAAALGAKHEPGEIARWVDLWLDLDSTYGVKYAQHQPNPYEAFFAGPQVPDLDKVASAVVVIESVMVPKAVIADLPEDAIRRNFSKEAADKITEAVKCAHADPAVASNLLEAITRDERKELLNLTLATA